MQLLRCLACAMLLFTSVFVTGCSSAPKPEVRSVTIDFTIKVKDPILRQLTEATEQVEIQATGLFNPGTYAVHGMPVTVPPDTRFKFALKLPIKNLHEISTRDASGELTTTQPLSVKGVALPASILLSHGKVSGEVDLVRTMGSFFFNLLQFQFLNQAEGGDIQQMIANMNMERASLVLRPNSVMKIGKNKLHVGKESSVTMTNLVVDKNLDYKGLCKFKINFAQDSSYIGEKVDTIFNGGSIDDSVSIERRNKILTLSPLPDHAPPSIILKDCTYKFGRSKTSVAQCDSSLISIKKFDWANYEDDSIKSSYHFDALMTLSRTRLWLDFPTYTIDALFPGKEETTLKLFSDTTGHGIDFATHEAVAQTADIKINRPKTSITLALTDAKLGSIDFTKGGDLNFALSEGTSGLRSFAWSNDKRSFGLTTGGGSTIAITKGMAMALNRDHPGAKMQGTIPLSVKLGDAKLANGAGHLLDFSKLNGQVTVDLASEVEINGKAAFTIAQCQLLGETPADVRVQGFKLSSGEKATMTLNNCSIIVPRGTIASMIKKQLPEEKTFELNKPILEEKRWRYKHGVITKLTVRKPVVENLSLTAPNKAVFKVDADVQVDGTIEKAGILATMMKDVKKWDTKPWTATSPCSGSGTVTFSFVPNKTLADSDFNYDLDLQMPLPKNIDVDWHKVSGGLICKAETSVISDYLNKCAPFHGSRTVPLDHKGSMKLFASGNKKLQTIRISDFALKPTTSGTEVDFTGEASL